MPLNDSWIVTQDDDFPTLAGLNIIDALERRHDRTRADGGLRLRGS
jgi:hypothetical protein